MANLLREIRFSFTENMVRWTMLIAVLLSAFSLVNGHHEINQQREQIEILNAASAADQSFVLSSQPDAGDAAYYGFHFTYDPPSELAFAALGMRDELPWKHRLRMLALEGQIYELDPGNPELSQLGQLDFTYLVSLLLPLLLIGLLYDLDARERRESRYELLSATSHNTKHVLLYRAGARVLLLFASIVVPFLTAALFNSVALSSILVVLGLVAFNALFWFGVCRLVTTKKIEGVTAAVTLFGIWLLLTSVVPVGGKFAVEQLVPVPDGGELLFTQRETVNDGWDLPKQTTMQAFVSRHPEWREDTKVDQPFEWKWYYAFQQVGDQVAEPLSQALKQGMAKRDQWMAWVSIFSPPLLTERWLTKTANTDVDRHLDYLACVRDFHAELRHFHYPLFFGQKEFSATYNQELPQFKPCAR